MASFGPFSRLLERLRRLRAHMRAERVDEIARRYLIMNAFDGALSILSVIASAYFVGATDPRIIVAIGLANCMAMGISGFTGTFMTERAERMRRLRELESVMLTDLSESDFNKVSLVAPIYVAFIDGIAPVMAALVSLAPLITAILLPIDAVLAIQMALAFNLATLFVLGAFLGRVSRTNVAISGLKMVAIGLITALICVVFKAM